MSFIIYISTFNDKLSHNFPEENTTENFPKLYKRDKRYISGIKPMYRKYKK